MALRNSKKIKNCSCGCVKGKVRDNNEDNFYFAGQYLEPDSEGLEASISESIDLMKDDKRGHLFAVFDGMGGGQHGEIASYEAAKCLSEYIQRYEKSGVTLDVFMLETLCKKLNERVYAAGVQKGASVMGTTIAAMYFRDDKQWSCNVGDSRCYRLRGGVLEKLSEDHVEGMYSIGRTKKNKKPGLIQYLGMDPEEILLEPTIHCSDLQKGDTYLLCSDGLTDMVTEADIASLLNKAADAEEATAGLVELALENGGKDNITAIVCKC